MSVVSGPTLSATVSSNQSPRAREAQPKNEPPPPASEDAVVTNLSSSSAEARKSVDDEAFRLANSIASKIPRRAEEAFAAQEVKPESVRDLLA